jgi:hypothetical protein
VGYKKATSGGILVRTNPVKSDRVTFGEEDYLIVIAQDSR